MRLRTALLATTLIAAGSVAAQADTITGPYVSLGAGYDLLMTEGVHYSPTGFPGGEPDGAGDVSGASKSRFSFKDGVDGFGSVGYGIYGVRIELEGLYLWDELSKVHGTYEPGNSQGHQESYGPMVNVLYDIDFSRFGINLPVTPYVGIGAGYLWTHLSPISNYYVNGDVNRTGGTEGSFAYQGIIGVAYNVAPVPGLALTLDYRFIGDLNQGAFNSTSYAPHGLHIVNADLNQSFHHEVNVGLRYAFNAAPPPPPPAPAPVVAPAPAPARTYLVFFDWDKSYLTPRARQIVAEAAQNSTRVQTTTLEVNGYADTSHALPGSRGHEYNLRLSLRRADSVKAELIRDGVPASVITVHGYGDSHLLVPTGPNVREPQNRRVEIILH